MSHRNVARDTKRLLDTGTGWVPIVHDGEKEKICRRGRNDMANIHSPKARAIWEARGKIFVHHITSKSLPRRIGVFQLQHRVGYPRARKRFQVQARREAPLRYRQAVRAKIKVPEEKSWHMAQRAADFSGRRATFCADADQHQPQRNHESLTLRGAQECSSTYLPRISGALHFNPAGLHNKRKLITPHLPLAATETQAHTQDPGALRLNLNLN